MSKAIITLTKGGLELGLRLLQEYEDSILYINKRFDIKDKRVFKIESGIKSLVEEIFFKFDCIIFVMATGIVVRSIAPYIKSKTDDPAIIVVDEKGKNVISLLSGHIGGANKITLEIAKKLNSNPVITTASDINDSIAVDTLAMKYNCVIEDLKDATRLTSHIVNGERVGIVSDINIEKDFPKNIEIIENLNKLNSLKGLIYITNKKDIDINLKDKAILRPKNLIIGIGCRKGKEKEDIIKAINNALNKINKSPLSIKHIATVDVKQYEKGIIKTAKHFNVPLVIVDREDIRRVEDNFKISKFVKKSIGVGAVAEPVAALSSNNGRIILNKTKYEGITIAIAEEGGY